MNAYMQTKNCLGQLTKHELDSLIEEMRFEKAIRKNKEIVRDIESIINHFNSFKEYKSSLPIRCNVNDSIDVVNIDVADIVEALFEVQKRIQR